ncbi:hypothetical protein FQN60_012569 [Etheostoma spectabile]|uniref:Uncharacterized protein n=1 Tax=Etheostoma spectabile TaxID=54343 RepID=A0A5J5CAW6_9PERO|nr:hypothetical protein FQN60_018618 [Etheostoma spectabile]KAA8578767.1 hypothetical protein FQN60_012569 [Etheostoma spectabile]
MEYLSVLRRLRAPGAAPQEVSLPKMYAIAKKLAGVAAGSAAWVTNVGNEYGQVLMSVLTAGEGDGLTNMAAGLMRR